ncbi:hypothetical protein K439DRAFT_1624353 [Ramaria rubella]|nr:hypothetical protein K439DRAFT_1624353 [Ramaria rubella]
MSKPFHVLPRDALLPAKIAADATLWGPRACNQIIHVRPCTMLRKIGPVSGDSSSAAIATSLSLESLAINDSPLKAPSLHLGRCWVNPAVAWAHIAVPSSQQLCSTPFHVPVSFDTMRFFLVVCVKVLPSPAPQHATALIKNRRGLELRQAFCEFRPLMTPLFHPANYDPFD